MTGTTQAARHDWNLTPAEAIQLQRELAGRVRMDRLLRPPETVAGLDVAFGPGRSHVYAVVAVYRLTPLELIDRSVAVLPVTFPYVPGLLSFREAPALLAALEQLAVRPDCLLVDGHGYAHPRRFGLACHLGVLLEMPSVGCAKSVLVGQYEEPTPERGEWTPLRDGDEVVGAAVRTRSGVRPVFVSVGHLVDLASAIQITLAASSGKYRIPEPLREADRLSRMLAREGDPRLAQRYSRVVRSRTSRRHGPAPDYRSDVTTTARGTSARRRPARRKSKR